VFSVPENVCLLGCVFYIADYQKYLEYSTLDMWRKVVNMYCTSVYILLHSMLHACTVCADNVYK